MLFLAIVTLLSTSSAMASCWEQAGDRYGIEPELLQAIATVESGMKTPVIGHNRNGTIDVGLMQINSSHLVKLKKYHISKTLLLTSPCVNVMTGAWILADNMVQFGYSWEAVGAYNAGNGNNHKSQVLRARYIKKVASAYQKIKSNNKGMRRVKNASL